MKYQCPDCRELKDESEFNEIWFCDEEQKERCKECQYIRDNWFKKRRQHSIKNTKQKIKTNSVFYNQRYNSDGEKVYISSQVSILFEWWNYKYEKGVDDEDFNLESAANTHWFNPILHYYRSYSDKKLGIKIQSTKQKHFYTINEIYEMSVFVLELHKDLVKKDEILIEDSSIDVCEYILSHKTIKDAGLIYKEIPKKINPETKHKAVLYSFMKDFGRFPNEEEEREYLKNADLDKMVAELQRTTKKVRGAEK